MSSLGLESQVAGSRGDQHQTHESYCDVTFISQLLFSAKKHVCRNLGVMADTESYWRSNVTTFYLRLGTAHRWHARPRKMSGASTLVHDADCFIGSETIWALKVPIPLRDLRKQRCLSASPTITKRIQCDALAHCRLPEMDQCHISFQCRRRLRIHFDIAEEPSIILQRRMNKKAT